MCEFMNWLLYVEMHIVYIWWFPGLLNEELIKIKEERPSKQMTEELPMSSV